MRGMPMVLWTCDKCGDTATTGAESTPPAWRTVEAGFVSGGGSDYRADWCGHCIRDWLKPKVDRSQDSSA